MSTDPSTPDVLVTDDSDSSSDILKGCGLYKLDANSPPEALESAAREMKKRLAGLDAITLAALREEAVRQLKKSGYSSPAAIWDAALDGGGSKTAKTATEDAKQGRALPLTPVEPWADPVDGSELLNGLTSEFTRFLSLPEGAATALALWTMHAHAHDAAFCSPFLALTSPEKRCGKSTTLALLAALVPKPLQTSNVPAAALFRTVDAKKPTLLIDEADSFLTSKNADEALRGLLNAGHTRDGFAVRCVGDTFEAREFSTWAPKAVALIGRLPGTIEDRSIVVKLQRQPAGERRERLRLDRLKPEAKHLLQKAARWAEDNMAALTAADPSVPEELNDRQRDNWRALLAIADAAGGTWPERARKAALKLSGGAVEDDSAGPMLLADLQGLFAEADAGWIATTDIVSALAEMEHRPWPEWRQGKPITPTAVGKLLKPYGITPKQIRTGTESGNKIRGYERKDCENAFSRYLPDLHPVHPVQTSNSNDLHPVRTRYNADSVPGTESTVKPCGATHVPGVPGEKGVHGAVHPPELEFAPVDERGPELNCSPDDEQEEGRWANTL